MKAKLKRLLALLSIPKRKLPRRRILITVDLDDPILDDLHRNFVERISRFGIPLTLFSPNSLRDHREGKTLQTLISFALQKRVRIEVGSHSITHESLNDLEIRNIQSIIEQSISSFQKEGIPVRGFRAPYLSIEPTYRAVLSTMNREVLAYDSSVLFEGNLLYSHLHDLLPRKCPHRVGEVWELPLSCLDDSLLYEKLKKPDAFVSVYWRKKMESSLRHHGYFLLLIHPVYTMSHFQGVEDLLNYGIQKYSKTAFTTCSELVAELNQLFTQEGLPIS